MPNHMKRFAKKMAKLLVRCRKQMANFSCVALRLCCASYITAAAHAAVMIDARLLNVEDPVRPARVHAPQGTSKATRSPARGFNARILSNFSMIRSEELFAIYAKEIGEEIETRYA